MLSRVAWVKPMHSKPLLPLLLWHWNATSNGPDLGNLQESAAVGRQQRQVSVHQVSPTIQMLPEVSKVSAFHLSVASAPFFTQQIFSPFKRLF